MQPSNWNQEPETIHHQRYQKGVTVTVRRQKFCKATKSKRIRPKLADKKDRLIKIKTKTSKQPTNSNQPTTNSKTTTMTASPPPPPTTTTPATATAATTTTSSLPVFDMSQSVCVITGSNSGFGLEVARKIAQQGGSVVISGRSTAKNETRRDECLRLGASNAIAVTLDVSDPLSVKHMFEQTRAEMGGRNITHVFINAGVFPSSCENYALEEDDDVALDEINKTIDINIKGVMYTSRYAFKTLVEQKQGGCVVFTSSVGASMSNGCGEILPAGNTVFNLYTSTKTFVDSIARGSTTFLKDHGIRTYTISPSAYITGMNDNKGDDDTGSVVNPLLKDYSGDPNDVADVVLKMMDGTTSWKSGSNVGCEGPFTYDVHQRYKLMYEPESFGIASPTIPLDSLCDTSGQPVKVTQEDLKTIHKQYKAGKEQAAAAAAQ